MAEQANGWFYTAAVENPKKTKEKGMLQCDSVTMIEITIPGDNKQKFVDYANDEYKARFPAAWEAFQNAEKGMAVEGMPLETWPLMTAAKVKELKSINIHSVEQLAEMPDAFIQRMGIGSRELVEQAKAYIIAAQDGPDKLMRENTELKGRVEAVEELLKASGDVEKLIEENKRLQTEIETLKAAQVNVEMPDEEKAEQEAEAVAAAEKAEKAALRKQVEAKTGQPVKGNPSIETLKKALED